MINALLNLGVVQSADGTGRQRPLVPTLVVAAIALILPYLKRRYVASASKREHVFVNGVLFIPGLAVLVGYAVKFRGLSFPPPTAFHGVALAIIITIPLILVVLCGIELWNLLVRDGAVANGRET